MRVTCHQSRPSIIEAVELASMKEARMVPFIQVCLSSSLLPHHSPHIFLTRSPPISLMSILSYLFPTPPSLPITTAGPQPPHLSAPLLPAQRAAPRPRARCLHDAHSHCFCLSLVSLYLLYFTTAGTQRSHLSAAIFPAQRAAPRPLARGLCAASSRQSQAFGAGASAAGAAVHSGPAHSPLRPPLAAPPTATARVCRPGTGLPRAHPPLTARCYTYGPPTACSRAHTTESIPQ
ncbi:unnamed protein product, partial [Closterium sp. NIES-53]